MESHTPAAGRLLVVDDEENIVRSLKRVLKIGPWEIETANSGAQALEVMERFQPHVVLTDFRMPGLTGVELLIKVRERFPQTQRVMLTGQADQQAIEDAINLAEVHRFMTKPWNDAQLVSIIRGAFEHYALVADVERLHRITLDKNVELARANTDLELRVQQRTEALMLAKVDWERTFDTIDTPLALVQSADLTLRRTNVAAARISRRRLEDGPGTRCHEFLFGRKEKCEGCAIAQGLREPATSEIHFGERLYALNLYPMTGHDTVVCNYHDVTEERAITKRLIESEKMIAIGNLAGGVAHEINNPLGGILAFSQLMKRDAGRTPADQESLSLIEESALRCKRIVESLLKFSRRSKDVDRRSFDLSRCVEDAVLLFNAQAKKFPRLKVSSNLTAMLPETYGDPAQVGQVVLNLLQNALQAIPQGEGTISVATGQRDAHVWVSVRDSGTGIAPEVLPRIFEPHFTTKPPGEGTGLGLAIGYRIVVDHGGHFEVDTKLGVGSTFTVVLPVQPGGSHT